MATKPTYEELERKVKELEKKADQESDQEKEAILNSLIEHVIHQDTEMKILWANRAACESVNLTHGELVGRYCYEVWPQQSDSCPDCPVLKAMETRQPQEIEKATPDGRSWLIRGYPEIDRKGDVVGGIEVTLEVTKRKQAEEALKESEEKYRTLFNNAADLIAVIDTEGNFLELNEKFEEESGYNKREIIGKSVFTSGIITKYSAEKAISYLEKLLAGKRWPSFEVDGVRKDGKILSYELRAVPIRKDGKIVAIQAILRNIAERKKVDKALKESEQRYRSLFESTGTATFVADEDMTVIQANAKCEEISGYPRDEIVGKMKTTDFIPVEELERIKKYHLGRREKDSIIPDEYEFKLVDKNGDKKDVFIQVGMIPETKQSIASIIDITPLRQAEDALRKSEEKYRSFIENAPVAMYTINTNGEFTYGNKKLLEMIEYKIEDWLNKPFHPIVHPEDLELAVNKVQDRIEGKGTADPYEIRILDSSGRIVWVKINSESIYETDERGNKKLVGMQSFVEEITGRKRAEEALRESEEKYRTVLETSLDPIVVYDMEGKVTYFNPSFTRIFGWTLEERLHKKMDLFVPDDAWPETQEMIEKVLSGESFSGFETRRYTKEEGIIHVNMSAAIYKDQNGNPIGSVINLRDISDQRKLESQLQQAQKMEALGTLAGGIAHDFNNLLMGIQGRTSLMLMEADSYHPYFEHLKGIENYIKSAADLTKQLLAFARGGKYEVKPTDSNELLNKSSEMFGRTKKEVNIHMKSQEDIWTVDVDRSQIEQVLLNLYVNAWQSMPGGGELYLKTENVMLDSDYVKPYSLEPGKYVKISVTDTGVGMDNATQERIFDPFFTTKEMGRGTGLGLASAFGIIKNHGGIINVYSEKGEGATFNIYLPVSEKEIISEKKLSEEVLTGLETILLVDDEDMIIDVGKELLKKIGYKVLIARSGKAAVELYEANKDEIDIVILDMIMPDMGGGETYNKLKEINPDIKVLLSSGYSVDGQATEILERGCDGFIQKPFSMINLSQKLRGILDEK